MREGKDFDQRPSDIIRNCSAEGVDSNCKVDSGSHTCSSFDDCFGEFNVVDR